MINGRRQYAGNINSGRKKRISRSYGYNVEDNRNNLLLTPVFSENDIDYDNNHLMEDEDEKNNGTVLEQDVYDENSEHDVETSSENSDEAYNKMFEEDLEQEDMEDDDINDNLNDKENYLTVDEAEMQEFDFKALLEQLLSTESENENDIHEERYLLPRNPEISLSTIKQFSVDINAVFAGYNAQQTLIDDVFSVLQKHLPGVDWPMNISENGNHRIKKVKSNLKEFISEDTRALRFDVCRNGCVAFIGEYFECILCPVCEAKRFYPCSAPLCKGKPYQRCEHVNRISHKIFHYR